MARRPLAPVWLMGLANAVFGMFGGIISISVPQLLSARHVPEASIAAFSAAIISPAFWTFLFSPVLDVRFSRRSYAVATACGAAVFLALALMNLDKLGVAQALFVAGFFCANLYQSALGGWLSTIVTTQQQNPVSLWLTVGNIAGGGAMAMVAGQLFGHLSTVTAAVVLGLVVALPIVVFAWMPAPGPDRRLASESFPRFFGEVLSLLRQRAVLIAVVLFLAPAATFSLTNFLSGLGEDFHASVQWVAIVGGVGVMAGGLIGCFIFRLIERLLPLRYLYLGTGVFGAVFTMAAIFAPPTPATFGMVLIGENVFQALAITISVAIAFEAVGRGNPLAATSFSLMTSAFNVPITYMLFIDGAGYAAGGLGGSLAADAGASLGACMLLGAVLKWLAWQRRSNPT